MSKKILSVVLALVFVLSIATTAFAAGGYGYEEEGHDYKQTWALSEPVDNGNGTWTVKVSLTANYKVGAIEFTVQNTNPTGVVLKATAGKDIPEAWNATVGYKNASGKVSINPDPIEDAVDALDCTAGKEVAVLTYTVADGATAQINIKNDPKAATTPGGTLIAARMPDGNVVTSNPVCGQTVVSTGATRNIGAVASVPPTLVPVEGTIAVVDTTHTDLDADNEGTTCDGYLLGFDPDNNGAILDELFVVEGDGYATVVANDQGMETATGTMVELYDNNDELKATYVVIVFGDVNGDGAADPIDASAIEEHDAWGYGEFGRLFTYQAFAGDIDVSGDADPVDASGIEEHDAWGYGETGRIDPATIIATLGL